MLRRGRFIVSVLLVLGLLLLPAAVSHAGHEQQTCPDEESDTDNRHPSGNDRHCEGGDSFPQGTAQSDPDGTGNDGVDQPGGEGGDDHADQDGNNGCGNDDDFEDDNNGRCLGRQGGQTLSQEQTESNVSGSVVENPKKSAVLGAVRERSGFEEPTVLGEAETAETSVLGAAFTRPSTPPTAVLGVEFVRGQALAATGAPLSVLGLLALGLITSGMVARQTARRRPH